MEPLRPLNANVTMIRRDLAALPHHALPEGLAIRPYAPGDERAWVAIQSAADAHNVITERLFRDQFGDDPGDLARRLFLLVDRTTEVAGAGRAIGTAAAWFDDTNRGAGFGRVHWLAIHPDQQGRGLAKPLLGHVCVTLRELGHERAFLTTSTARIPAIGLYLRFGFVPEIGGPEDVTAWNALRRTAPWLAHWLDGAPP